MTDYYVRLIVELENQVKAQLEIIESKMKQVQEAAQQVSAAMKNVDTTGLDKVKTATSQADDVMDQLRNSTRQTTSALTGMNSNSINQLSISARNTSNALLTTSSSTNQLKSNINTISNIPLLNASNASTNLYSSLTMTSSSARQVGTALLTAGEGASQLSQALVAIQPYTLTQTSSAANQLDSALDSASMGAKQLDTSLDVIDVRAVEVSRTKVDSFKSKLLEIIPTVNQVKSALSGIGNINLTGLSSKIDGVKTRLSGLSASVRSTNTSLSGLNTGARVGGGGLNFLSSAASMTVGMIGFDLVNSMAMAGRDAINASGNFQAFGERMGMTASEIESFSQHCEGLQSSFKKVDMTAVGASALELGVKLQLPKESMEELTKTTAVMSSAFVKEGRTQTDAILAVSDAMDGQFRRLQELGINQEMLMQNGWDGDINNKTSLLQAMNKTLDEMGFTETAMQVNTLDEAYQMLTVSGGNLLEAVLVPLTPILLGIISALSGAIDWITNFAGQLQSAWDGLPDWAQEGAKIGIFMGAIILLSTAIIVYLVPAIAGGLMSALVSLGSMVGVTIIPSMATLSGAFMAVAGAVWTAVAPFLPFIIAAAAVAVAIYEIGKAFGWWTDVQTMIEAIVNNIGRLWDAFINHPDVKATIQAIQDAWEGLNEFLKPVIDWLKGIWDEIFPESAKGKVDITRMIIDALGATFEALTYPIKLAIQAIQTLITVLTPVGQAIMSVATLIGSILGPAITGIIQLLMGDTNSALDSFREAWQNIFDALGPVGDFLEGIFMPLFEAFASLLTGDLMGALDNFMLYWYNLLEAMGPVGDFIGEYLTPIFVTLVGIFLQVWNAVSQIIGVFQQFLSGQITLPQMLSQIWNIIVQMFTGIFGLIIQGIIAFAQNIWNNAVNAGKNLLDGVITYVQQLPGRVFEWIGQTGLRILAGAVQWVTNARNKAKEVVDGVINWIKQLPGKVYQEFMNIGSRIMQAGSDLVNKAKQIGQNIVDGLLGAMGIHSPGIIQESVVNEFVNMLQRVKDKGTEAYDNAKSIGKQLIDGFQSQNVADTLSEAVSFTPTITTEDNSSDEGFSVNQDNGESGSDETGGAYAIMGEDIAGATESIMASNQMIGNSFTTLTNSINLNTGIIRTRTAGIVTSFNTTKIGVTSALNNMNMANRNAWNGINTATVNNLDQIQSSTLATTSVMNSAWMSMKDSIVSAATQIRTKANAEFNNLSSNIGTFYRRIQNPSSWGSAGPATGGRTGRVSRGVSSLRNIVNNAIAPSRNNVSAGTAPLHKLASSVCKDSSCKEFFLTGNNSYERIDIEGFYKSLNNNFAGWGDWSSKHLAYIKKRTGEWDMKGPVINLVGGIPTGLAFKVKQFENGSTPSLGMDSFQRVAEAIFNVIGYDYYWNSDKTGDPITALQTGSVNCWDGAHSLMALANVFGLSASLGRGTGHVWAVVNGKTFDTTNYSLHRSWSPLPGYTGPRIRSNPSKSTNNNDNESNNEFIDLNINHDVNINVTGDGNINIDESTIIDTLKEIITEKSLVDKIAEALIKRDRRIQRMGV